MQSTYALSQPSAGFRNSLPASTVQKETCTVRKHAGSQLLGVYFDPFLE